MSSVPHSPSKLPPLFRMPLAVLGTLAGLWAVMLGVLLPFFWPSAIQWLIHPPTSLGLSALGISVLVCAVFSPFLLILGVGTSTGMPLKKILSFQRKALAFELLLGSFLWLLADIVRLFQTDPHVQRLLLRKMVLLDLKMVWAFPGIFFGLLLLALGYGLLTRDKLRDQAGLFFTTLAYQSIIMLALFGQILQGMRDQASLISQAVTKKAFLGLHSDIATPIAKALSFTGLSATSISKHLAALLVILYLALPTGLLLWSWSKQKGLSLRGFLLLITSPIVLAVLVDRLFAISQPAFAQVVLESSAGLLSLAALFTLCSLALPVYALVGLSIKEQRASLLHAATLWVFFTLTLLLLRVFLFYGKLLPSGQSIHKITLALALIIPIAGLLGVFMMQADLRLRTQLIFSAPLWVPFFFVFFLWSLITNTTIYFINDLTKRDFQPPLWMRIFPLSLLSLILFPVLLVIDFLVGIVRQLGESMLDALYPKEERITEDTETSPLPATSLVYALGTLLMLTLPLWGIPALLYMGVRLFVYEAIILQLLGGSAEDTHTVEKEQQQTTP
ncbi:MAG: hypothetical protein H6728_05000 [Myxococcales bacterium]|nr:hypothetical protein [Myxococcales bacterium]